MLLFSPSPGQIADRMTILELKVQKAKEVTPALDAALNELERCRHELATSALRLDSPSSLNFDNLVGLLRYQNARQWEYEDGVRVALKCCTIPPTYEQLLDVTNIERLNAQGNETRAELVRKIDGLFRMAPEIKAYK